jgi:hypothetical protein
VFSGSQADKGVVWEVYLASARSNAIIGYPLRAPGKANMPFCAICGRHHEPGIGCFEGTGELMKESGIRIPPATPKEGTKKIIKEADRWFRRMLLWVLIVIVLVFLFVELMGVRSR